MTDHLEPWKVLGPPPGTCPACAVDHPATEPHNQQSLTYQYSFYREHGRWPRWQDALAHCAGPVKEAWEAELRKRGAWKDD